MDLHSLQQQLKGAIQSHQILVSKMKADPQNAILQKQLHELQAEIMALSEKQKQVVQQLRKEIEIKHQSANSVCSHLQHNQEVHSITVQATTLPLMKLESIPVKAATNTTVVIPATFTLKVPSDHKPVYVTSPLHIPKHVGEPPSAASPVALNLAPTIRVPQYPPLPQQPPLRPVLLQNQSRSLSKSPPCPRRPPPVPKASESPKPKLTGADVIKVDFMAALGLITHDTLSELQNRRSERKRRTTANPQFSYGNWEHGEKKRKMNNYLTSPVPPQQVRRPRGRPRLGSMTPNSRPTTPDDRSEAGSPNGFTNTVLRNGSLGQEHEEVCSVCHNPGSLLNCDTCTLSYHRDCLESSLIETIPGSWMCPKCQLMKKIPLQWPGSLAMVHSYIAHKAAKEEEKRKLVKRSLELKTEHGQLELKAKQLSDAITIQMQKRSELLTHNKKTQDSIEKLKTFIKFFQVS